MNPPPPPPPPHGSPPGGGGKASGLPDGKYDIFIVPPHSAGSGFLYLPSLQTNRNSFIAGVACTAFAFFVYSVAVPVVKEWFYGVTAGNGSGVMILTIAVGVACWAWGKTQSEWASTPPGNTGGGGGGGGGSAAGGTFNPGHSGPSQPNASAHGSAEQPGASHPNGSAYGNTGQPQPGPSHPNGSAYGNTGQPQPGPSQPNPPPPGNTGVPPPKSSWQRPNPQTTGSAGGKPPGKTTWEKAREETKKKEEERRKTEEAKKRREDAEKERQKQRDKETREREGRERKEKRERDEKEKEKEKEKEREIEKGKEKEREMEKEKERERELERQKERDRELERQKLKEREMEKEIERAREILKEREREIEKEKEKERERQKAASEPAAKPRFTQPSKPPHPSARTENEDDAYSFRPYDRPKKPVHKANSAASMYSESSYAPSQTTARTTPPLSSRGPYHTKDPDKIIIKGVYSFTNAFMRTPVSQLISGQGNVTDGLILRITTEGLFIDDDVRGVPQREWDVKAWTMKLAEVWCPNFLSEGLPTSFGSPRQNASQHHGPVRTLHDAERFLKGLSEDCETGCRDVPKSVQKSSSSCFSSGTFSSTSLSTAYSSNTSPGTNETVTQSGEMMGLHVLRASIRDQEGKKYVFVLSQSEGWKVAIGLQRLRRGTQVRALGVSGLPQNETKMLIENLGWA